MRAMNFGVSLICVFGMLSVLVCGEGFAVTVREHFGQLACDVTVVAGFGLIALNGVIGGRCFAAAAFGTDDEQYIA